MVAFLSELMKPTTIRRTHRWLGLIFSITILTSSGSGLLHVWMTRTQSAPPPARPAGGSIDPLRIRVTPAEILAKYPSSPVVSMNLLNVSGRPFYQTFVKDRPEPVYIDASDGVVVPAESVHAAEIAAAYLGTNDLEQTGHLKEFDDEYINIFRILPVYRFDLKDGRGTRVYVSTVTGSVTRHTDNRKQFEASIFTNLHKLGFIPNKTARDIALSVFAGGAFVVSLLGIVLFFLTRPKRPAKKAKA